MTINKFILAAVCGIICTSAAFAQEEDDQAALEQGAKSEAVQKDLDEPDGVSLAIDEEDGSYKIFARGTGVYDFDDEDDRQEALQEATLKAKANLSKFLNETIATDEGLESMSKKAKTLSKNGDVTTQAVTKESVKTTGLSIRNSSKTLLTGAITLESKRIPGNGDGGTYQVTIGVSSKTAAAAKEISNRMTDSLNDRRKVKGDGSNIGEGGNNGSGAASSPMPGSGAAGAPYTKKGPNANNTRETRKAKTVF